MGLTFSQILDSLGLIKQDMRIVMLGLDAAGKTTLLYKMKLGEVSVTVPTIGFNVESLDYKNIHFTVWDVGGQDKIRQLWNYYFSGSNGVIFVVDSNDQRRIETAKEELYRIYRSDELKGVPLLVYANKQDLPHALSCSKVAQGLELNGLKNCGGWHVQSTCAVSGDGIYEGLDKMVDMLKRGVH